MTGDLREYNQKRNFYRTSEPIGEAESSEEGLRFVVQHHMARKEHYDLRLEWAGVLLSWAVPKGPSYNKQDKRLAVQVEDHPMEYRNFEGTIPKGEYGGGIVMLWDEGFWEPLGNVEESLQEGALKFILKGNRLQGKWALIRIKGKAGEAGDNWLLLKEKDPYVKDNDGISDFITSIRTGRTMEEIERGEDDKFIKNPFHIAEVQLAKLVKSIPEDENWLYELKYDGYRIIAYVEGNSVRLLTRNGNDYVNRFHDVATSLIRLSVGRPMVLDGEIAVTDPAGKTDFQALQSYMKNPKGKNLTYIVFDLLALDGVDLRSQPLIRRKELLEKLMKAAPHNLYYSRYVRGKGRESFTVACEAGMEGIVGKKANSIYSGTRNGDWIKLKCDKRQEFVIGGYTLSEKKTSGISSLLLGVYEGEDLVYAGRAGTGISEAEMKVLEEKFKNIRREASPFRTVPSLRANESIVWLEPELVAEVKFAEWTLDRYLRQASYKGLRKDKDPREIKREKAAEDIEDCEDKKADADVEDKDVIEDKEDKGNGADRRYRSGRTGREDYGDRTGREDYGDRAGREDKGGREDNRDRAGREDKGGRTGREDKGDRTDRSGRAGKEEIQTPDYVKEEEGSAGLSGNVLLIQGIRISSPDKVLFDDPKITKEMVARYYSEISERMLPYVSHRLLSTIRCPKGISQTCFFKKHPGPGSKEVITIPVTNSSGETEEYFYIENSAGLVSEAQMGTLEFHIWGSSVETLEMPDMMVFDLDPDEGMELSRVRQGVLDVKDILTELSLHSYLKISGGKGYHVVVPLKPVAPWDVFYDFARRVAEVMEYKWPERYTSNVRKARRSGKIFIDWMRNGRGATSVAPYSLRARKGARVSMPIAWEELDMIAPDGISMEDALRRLSGNDPWKDFFENNQRLK